MNPRTRRLALTFFLLLGCFIVTGTLSAQTAVIPPVFSVSPGFYDEPVSLQMLHPLDDAEIWFTTDGSSPVKNGEISNSAERFHEVVPLLSVEYDSSSLSAIRTNPIETNSRGFGWRSPSYEGYRANTIRAVARLSSGIISQENHGTWFIGIEEPELPVISIITDRDDLFSDARGIYVPGDIYNENGYGPNIWGFNNANYHQRGDEWERSAQFEYYVGGQRVLGQQVGLRIHGSGSRALPMKSLRVYARSDYGVSTLNYPFFGKGNDQSFKRLLLRNSGQDFAFRPTMFRDGAIQQIGRSLNVITQDFQPALVYINGEYWGIHNIRERYDHHYFERRTGIVRENLDFLTYFGGVKEGDDVAFNELVSHFRNLDLADSLAYVTIAEQIDIANFIDYKLLNIHFVNLDWPGNNIDYFRYRGEPVSDDPFKDGRFRWIAYDLDAGFDVVDKDMLIHSTEEGNADWPNPDWSTLFLRKLLENEHFSRAFITRYIYLLNTVFHPEYISAVINERQQAIQLAMSDHVQRWGYPYSMEEWNHHIERHHDFAVNRRDFAKTHLEDFFDIDILSVNLVAPHGALQDILVNGIKMSTDQLNWSIFHQEGEPLTIQIISSEGFQFTEWSLNGEILSESSVLVLNPESDLNLELVFDLRAPSSRKELIHFWFFDEDLPNNTPLYTIDSWFSTGTTGILEYYPAIQNIDENNPSAGIMDRVNDPTRINITDNITELGVDLETMRGIRVRNPSKAVVDDTLRKSELVFLAPTSGYTDVSFSFAASRTANGQELMQLWYSTDSTFTWTPYITEDAYIPLPEDDFALFSFEFNGIEEITDNDNFAIRLTFSGETTTGFDGNVRFNNITMYGYDMSVSVDNPQIPSSFVLLGNYPNPFNPSTTIRYHLPSDAYVNLRIYDTLGRLVTTLVDQRSAPGTHNVVFDASGLSTGVYVYQLAVNGEVQSGKMLLIR
ncbi:MAG: CotH kinase family protein [Balneolales bacterium]|nr:CotH kinase family protein [Balneolales bacterium]